MTVAKKQTALVAGETEGFKAPGGGLRASIRDRIAAVAPYESKLVEVSEWDATIEVRSMSLGERNAMLTDADGDTDISALYPKIVLRCAYDPESGERIFGDDDEAFINTRPAHIIDKLAIPALQLSGMAEAALDDAAKKSSETESSD